MKTKSSEIRLLDRAGLAVQLAEFANDFPTDNPLSVTAANGTLMVSYSELTPGLRLIPFVVPDLHGTIRLDMMCSVTDFSRKFLIQPSLLAGAASHDLGGRSNDPDAFNDKYCYTDVLRLCFCVIRDLSRTCGFSIAIIKHLRELVEFLKLTCSIPETFRAGQVSPYPSQYYWEHRPRVILARAKTKQPDAEQPENNAEYWADGMFFDNGFSWSDRITFAAMTGMADLKFDRITQLILRNLESDRGRFQKTPDEEGEPCHQFPADSESASLSRMIRIPQDDNRNDLCIRIAPPTNIMLDNFISQQKELAEGMFARLTMPSGFMDDEFIPQNVGDTPEYPDVRDDVLEQFSAIRDITDRALSTMYGLSLFVEIVNRKPAEEEEMSLDPDYPKPPPYLNDSMAFEYQRKMPDDKPYRGYTEPMHWTDDWPEEVPDTGADDTPDSGSNEEISNDDEGDDSYDE